MAYAVDPNLPQSAYPFQAGAATPGTPAGPGQVVSANGPLPKYGPLYIAAGVALTGLLLAAPNPGSAAAGGDDNLDLLIVNTDGHAHVIVTPADAINGVDMRITFAAAAGGYVRLVAYGGVWYMIGSTGVTRSSS
jgi:hypothetical protein